MASRVIGLDCDGVLADFNAYLLRQVGSEHTVDEVDSFKVLRCIERWHGRARRDAAVALLNDPTFTLTQPMLPWAQGLVDACRKRAEEVIVITAPWRTDGWYDARVAWLQQNLGFRQDEVIVGSAKHLVAVDMFIDDRVSNVMSWAARNPSGLVLVPAWSYNDGAYPGNVRRMPGETLVGFIEGDRMGWEVAGDDGSTGRA